MMDKLLNDIKDKAKQYVFAADDYEKDGLMYCAKCNTPKQMRIKSLSSGNEEIIYCTCSCQQDEYKKKQEWYNKEQRLRQIESIRLSGIKDSQLLNCRFNKDMFPHSAHSIQCRNYCDNWEKNLKANNGLLFFGTVGTGKTFYAGCILNEILERYVVSVKATSLSNLMNGIFSASDKNEYIQKNIQEPMLLLIDDLGTERDTSYSAERIFEIIDERYKTKKPTIFTTNLTYAYMKNPTKLNEQRIFDRILEMCIPINFDGESIRKINANQKLKKAKEFL